MFFAAFITIFVNHHCCKNVLLIGSHVGMQAFWFQFWMMHFHIFWCDVMAQKWVVASPHQIIVIFLQTHGICHRFHISETERHCFCNMPYLKWFDAVLAGRFMLLNMNFILCRCKDTSCARNKKNVFYPLCQHQEHPKCVYVWIWWSLSYYTNDVL